MKIINIKTGETREAINYAMLEDCYVMEYRTWGLDSDGYPKWQWVEMGEDWRVWQDDTQRKVIYKIFRACKLLVENVERSTYPTLRASEPPRMDCINCDDLRKKHILRVALDEYKKETDELIKQLK